MGVSFDAAAPGADAADWRDYRAGLPQLDTGPLRRLVVIGAHPDDETLMAGGLIARAAAGGIPVLVVVATSGEASHPRSPTRTPSALAEARDREVGAAVRRLAPAADLVLLHLPDGALADAGPALEERLHGLVRAGDTVVSTWAGDRHPDHAAVACAASAAASAVGAMHLEAPIWAWHWGDPAAPPFPPAVRLDLDDAARTAKQEALALHATQIAPLSRAPGDEAVLAPGVLAQFAGGDEVFLPAGAQAVDFDAMYATTDDPWGFDDRWYEQRKRAVVLASLPRPRFRSVLEIGCSTGVTTALLADRADAVIGVDVADRAVEQARERLRNHPGARIEQRSLPEQWPKAWSTGTFDLIVLSEVGFYLAGDRLGRVIEQSREALAPGGVLVACHWRPQVLGLDRGGDAVHDVIRRTIGARRLLLHEEDDFLLEVFQTDPAPSVAQATGLR